MLLPLRLNLEPHYTAGQVSGDRQEIPEVYKYRPRVRFEFPKEEKEAVEIIEELAEKIVESAYNPEEIELALRLKLEQEQIQFKLLYLLWIQEIIVCIRDEEAAIFLLLH